VKKMAKSRSKLQVLPTESSRVSREVEPWPVATRDGFRVKNIFGRGAACRGADESYPSRHAMGLDFRNFVSFPFWQF